MNSHSVEKSIGWDLPPLYVSFHTGPGYAEEAAGLVESLNAFNLPHNVRALPDAGSWELNCGRKASYLLTMRSSHPGVPLVWLDADARVRRVPELFEHLHCDFAAHWKDGIELLSGTMFFSASEEANELLEMWRRECEQHPREWDQKNLQRLVERERGRWLINRLPAEYTSIFDAEMCTDPVIEHMQASRRLKR